MCKNILSRQCLMSKTFYVLLTKLALALSKTVIFSEALLFLPLLANILL